MAKPLSNESLSLFAEQFALILHSGISPIEGISILEEDSKGEEQERFHLIYEKLLETGDFSQSLEAGGQFPSYFLHMISLGERSGTLEDVFTSLAQHYDREDSISRSIREAVTYPLIMLGMLFAVLLLLVTEVMPVFRQVFSSLGLELSGAADLFWKAGQLLLRYSLILLILFFVLLLGAFLLLRREQGRKRLLLFFLHFPQISRISGQLAASRFASAFSIALHSGLDMEESFQTAAALASQPIFCQKLEQAKEQLKEGKNLPEAFKAAGIFTGMNARLVSLGFRTGSAEEVFQSIAQTEKDQADTRIGHLIAIIEPTIVAVLSIFAGLILISVMLPLLGILSGIG